MNMDINDPNLQNIIDMFNDDDDNVEEFEGFEDAELSSSDEQ